MRRALLTGLAALAVAASGGVVTQLRAASERGVTPTPSPSPPVSAAPSASPTPVPPLSLDRPLAPAGTLPAPTGPGIAATLARALGDPALGSRVNVAVADAAADGLLYVRGGDAAVLPASTAKLATAVAALQALGPDAVLRTRVVPAVAASAGVVAGDLVLVGGGDPTLASPGARATYPPAASVAALAHRVARSGVRRVTGRLVVDASLFTGPSLAPGWKATYVSEGSVAPVTALEVDGGRARPDRIARVAAPDLAAGRVFAAALRRAGVSIGDVVVRGRAPRGVAAIAEVTSPPVAALVERMLARSDNDLAEALGRHVALALGRPASFAGTAAGLRAALGALGHAGAVDGLVDGSGLSRLNRTTVADLVTLLRLAADRPELRPALAGLPVAGFTGTLAKRFDRGAARAAVGLVRAKTGSLDNVSTLAGFAVTRSGRVLLFAFSADRLPTKYVARAARVLDAAAAALAACGCA